LIPGFGGAFSSREWKDALWTKFCTGAPRRRRRSELTPRELHNLSLLAEGKVYTRIAEELGVSYKTVANTCSQLKIKVGASNLAELIHRAIRYIAASPAPIVAAGSR
jgi:DNA-binding NarL/FixJ family response regulator